MVDLEISVNNDSKSVVEVTIETEIFELDSLGVKGEKSINRFSDSVISLNPGERDKTKLTTEINNPKLWGPKPTQTPNLYQAVTTLKQDNKVVDRYETSFGIRDLQFNPDEGVLVNGEIIELKGVNQHHDLGALGAAFNRRAAERQLEKVALWMDW